MNTVINQPHDEISAFHHALIRRRRRGAIQSSRRRRIQTSKGLPATTPLLKIDSNDYSFAWPFTRLKFSIHRLAFASTHFQRCKSLQSNWAVGTMAVATSNTLIVVRLAWNLHELL